jgi:ubiquinone/menaquinone biosynthesis C-methylase UbiE
VSEPIRDTGGIKAFYDDPATVRGYLARRTTQPLNSVLHERQVAFLNAMIDRFAPRRMLEVAPGPGRLSAEVRSVAIPVAMDASPNMLAEARRRTREAGMPQWSFARGDAFRLPFASGAFDFAYSIRLVRHFDRAGRQKLYREFQRVLRPGGHLVIDAQNKLVSEPHRLKQGLDKYPVYDELWLRDELLAELAESGFVNVRLEGLIRQFTWQWRLNRLRRFRLGTPARVLIRALEWSPDRNPSTWMVLCEVPAR